MDFFKRNANEGSGKISKLVGTPVPANIFHYLNLFCVVDKRSKSSILRPMIEEWHEEASSEFSEDRLIKLAADMGYNTYKTKNKKRPFEVVLKQQENELKSKGLSEDQIALIIKHIKELKSKDKNKTAISKKKVKRKKSKKL